MTHAGKKLFRTSTPKFKLHFYQNVFQRFATREATLTTVESFCMEGIMAMGEPTIAEFSRMMQISTPNAAYKIGSLVKNGLCGKDPVHHRPGGSTICAPTQKYIDYYNISYSYLHTVVERARQRFTPEECAKLEQMLTIVSTELMPELDILKKGRGLKTIKRLLHKNVQQPFCISRYSTINSVPAVMRAQPMRLFGGKGLVQHHKGQRKGDDHAELINGHYLGRCTDLQSVVVAQPACAGGKAGQHQKQPAAARDVRNAGLGAGEEPPCPQLISSTTAVRMAWQGELTPSMPILCQNRGKGSEHRRPQRVNEPHGKRLLFCPSIRFLRGGTQGCQEEDDLECAPRFTGCGTQHPLRALGGTRVLLAAAPTAPPCFRRWRRSSSLHFGHKERKEYFVLQFRNACGRFGTAFFMGEKHTPPVS